MNLQQQIDELKANPNVGGVKWEIKSKHLEGKLCVTCKYSISNADYEYGSLNVFSAINKDFVAEIYYGDDAIQLDLKSTTLQEALLEALAIVKAKVMELAKELGFVCLDKEQVKTLNKLLNYTEVITAHTQRIKELPEPTGIYEMIEQLQQYLTEQGNEQG